MRQPRTEIKTTTLAILFAALACASCGAAPQEHTAEPRQIPPSDRDPLPFTPAPEGVGETDRTVALSATGGEDQARQMLLALVRAVRDADERRLEELFADELVITQGHARPERRARSTAVQRILVNARRGLIQPDVEVEELIDLSSVEVSRAAQHWQGREPPDGIRPTDVVVEVTLLPEGRALRPLLGWVLRGLVVVRPGRDARIVAL